MNEVENRTLGWRSLPGSEVVTAGVGETSIASAPGAAPRSRSTCSTRPPAGRAGAVAAGLFAARRPRPSAKTCAPSEQQLEAGEPAQVTGALAAAEPVAGRSMKAVRFYGKEDIRGERVPDPGLVNPRDAIVKVTATAICGSDLHIYGGYIPTMAGRRHPRPRVHGRGRRGRARQPQARRRRPRRRPVHHRLWSLLLLQGKSLVALRQLQPERLDGREAERPLGSGLFGYSPCDGGYPGGQAEFVRVP